MTWHLVTEDFPPGFTGGIATWAEGLARALVADGERVQVWARHTGRTAQHDSALPFAVHRVRGRHWSRWRDRWVQWALRGQICEGDRVLFATWGLAPSALGAIRRSGAQAAVAFHGSDLTQLESAPAPLHQVVGAAAALLPLSGFLAEELCRLGLINRGDSRLRVLPIPLAPVPARSDPGTGLLCVARPTALKGIDRARALAEALELPITLIGPPPEEGGTGILPRHEVGAHMARARAVVLLPRASPSGRGAEGLGIVLLEAAARGVPVIGCDTGGVVEAVGPGLVIDPDQPDLDRIRAFLDDPSAGARAQAWVRKTHGPGLALAVLRQVLP